MLVFTRATPFETAFARSQSSNKAGESGADLVDSTHASQLPGYSAPFPLFPTFLSSCSRNTPRRN